MSDAVGKVRRSQVLSSNGPGAIIDFRGPGGAPVSAVAAGLDEWDAWSIRKGLLNDQVIQEPRLEKKLGVRGFRLPPVGREVLGRDREGKWKDRERQVPAVRFPNWHVCPRCDALRQTREWQEDPGRPGLYCADCTGPRRKAKKAWVAPVRLIMTCQSGHLSEFPWGWWPPHEDSCSRRKPLKLIGSGAGLRGLRVFCTECHKSRSLDGALSPAMVGRLGLTCSGKRPWLSSDDEACQEQPVVLQRGASNVWFPKVASSLDIPPWGDRFQEELGDHWRRIVALDDRSELPEYVRLVLWPDWPDKSLTRDELVARIERRLEQMDAVDVADLRVDEHAHLTSGEAADDVDYHPDFLTRPELVPPELSGLLEHIVRVERLREVRAMTGFTRVSPPDGGDGGSRIAPISVAPLDWFPAVEVRGEGVFVGLDEAGVSEWEALEAVQRRADLARSAALDQLRSRAGQDAELPVELTPRLLLVHTLSHALAARLSLECGYSTASIRERLYISSGAAPMCGLLLYTAAPDADGTLGGLSREGRAERLTGTFVDAIRSLEWCSSDPLCSSGTLSLSDGSNLAACHACVFVPETTCEHFNGFLDRGMLVGTPEQPEIGYFRRLLDTEA